MSSQFSVSFPFNPVTVEHVGIGEIGGVHRVKFWQADHEDKGEVGEEEVCMVSEL